MPRRIIRHFFRPSLRGRILALLLALQLLALTIVGLVATSSVEQALLAHAQSEIEQTRKLLNAAFAPQLAERNLGAAQALFAELSSDQYLAYFVLENRDGEVFAQRGAERRTLPLLSADDAIESTGDTLHAQTRLTLNGVTYGRLRFGVSTRHLADYREQVRQQLLWLGAIALLVALLFLLVAGILITRPLERIADAVASFGRGELDLKLPVDRRDELGQLAEAFNSMADSLKSRLESLRQNEQKFHAIADYTHAAEFWFGPDGCLLWVNSSVERLSGYTPEECQSRNDFPLFLIHPEDRVRVMRQGRQALEDQTSGQDFEFRLLRRDGSILWTVNNWRPIFGESGEYLGIRASLESISERKKAQAELQRALDVLLRSQHDQRVLLTQLQMEHARLVSLLSAMQVGVLFVDREHRIVYANPGVARIWGVQNMDRHINGPVAQWVRAITRSPRDPALRAVIEDELADPPAEPVHREIGLSDGNTVQIQSFVVRDPDQQALGYLWLFEDVTKERITAEKLTYLAERDALTGLYNRHRFQVELKRMVSDARHSGQPLAMLYFDLDEFKHINDSYGHHSGDVALVRLSGEISLQLRRDAVFCRLGGDEFAVLAPACDEEEASRLAGRITHVIAQTYFVFGEEQLRLTGSIGIALYPRHADDAEELVTHADVAMYQAKGAGKNTWRIYRSDRDGAQARVKALAWSDRLGRALEHDLFRLYFQGVYRADDLQVSHLETLVYLAEDAHSAVVAPAQFIVAAENTGLILELDRWVLDRAVALLAKHPDLPGLAVNLSGRSLDDPATAKWIGDRLVHHGVASKRLLIEITETAAVQDLHDAQRFVQALRELGCRICLDDFGSGFASFIYLKHIATDIVKIDGEFIRNLFHDRDDQLFVRAIIDVARGMGKLTVAEFVEDERTLAMLRAYGVDMLQGYYFDRPQAEHPALTGVPIPRLG